MSVLLRERQGHVEILTINRPEARNAINGAVSRAFAAAFDELEADDDCWVVIVTGAGVVVQAGPARYRLPTG